MFLRTISAVPLVRARGDLRRHVLDPAIQEAGERRFVRLDVGARRHLRDEAGALLLRLTLGPFEAVPLATALPRLRVRHVEDDGP